MSHSRSAGSKGQALSFTSTSDGVDAADVVVAGRLDAVEAPAMAALLSELVRSGHRNLLIDLTDVTFVDSAGLAVLVRTRRETRSAGGDIILVRPASDDAMRVFRLTQFDQVFRMLTVRDD